MVGSAPRGENPATRMLPRDVAAAAALLSPLLPPTPLLHAEALDALAGRPLFLKHEGCQRGGAFKGRGATHALIRLSDEARTRGVITASSGNHGTALALAARAIGARAVVVMPEDATAAKRAHVLAAGGEIVLAGLDSATRMARALAMAEAEGLLLIPPYDHELIIAGQGTCALEAIAQHPMFAVFVAPCGGGGLLAGCALALAERADISVWGAEAERAADTFESFRQGRRIAITLPDTIADGMRNLVPGALTFPLIREHCAGIALVSEDEIREAMRLLLKHLGVMVEPTGAVAPAALLFRKIPHDARAAVAVISGANITPGNFAAVVEKP